MLTDLMIGRSALGHAGPDLTSHAEMQCKYGRFRKTLSEFAGQTLAMVFGINPA